MRAKFAILPIKSKLMILGLLLWIIAVFAEGITFSVLRFALHKDLDIVFYVSLLILLLPFFVLINKEQHTWREVTMKFVKATIFIATGLAVLLGGIHVGIDIAIETSRGDTIALPFALIALFWCIYFSVKAGQQLIPKKRKGGTK